jgi:predicted small metal-binding protein
MADQKRQHDHERDDLRVRCADLGQSSCKWEGRACDESGLMNQVERHGREKHNQSRLDDHTRNRVRQVMQGKSAA